jgi:hypothetical protein
MGPLNQDIRKPEGSNGLILEAWSQGFMVGALLIMAAITVSNMRRGVLLHKLILIEVRALVQDRRPIYSPRRSSSLACLMGHSYSLSHQYMDGTFQSLLYS